MSDSLGEDVSYIKLDVINNILKNNYGKYFISCTERHQNNVLRHTINRYIIPPL